MNKKMPHQQDTLFQCPASVRYVVEQTSIKLIDIERGRTCTLRYPDAAIWDFLCRGYARQKIEQLLVHICFITDQHAACLVDDFCARLAAAGFLRKITHHG